jgi:hypothetical protein
MGGVVEHLPKKWLILFARRPNLTFHRSLLPVIVIRSVAFGTFASVQHYGIYRSWLVLSAQTQLHRNRQHGDAFAAIKRAG